MTRMHRSLLTAALIVGFGAAPLATPLPAQSDRAALAKEAARLSAATNTFFRKLAADDALAKEFEQAARNRDYITTAGLVAKAAGISANEVRVTVTDRDAPSPGAAALGPDRSQSGPEFGHGPHAANNSAESPHRSGAVPITITVCAGFTTKICYTWVW